MDYRHGKSMINVMHAQMQLQMGQKVAICTYDQAGMAKRICEKVPGALCDLKDEMLMIVHPPRARKNS